jgi:hypothetical protein
MILIMTFCRCEEEKHCGVWLAFPQRAFDEDGPDISYD